MSVIISTMNDMRLENDIPCGMIEFTDEEFPRLTYINDRMRDMLGVKVDDFYEELLRDNIYFMFPQEEREQIKVCLEKAKMTGSSVGLTAGIMRSDGSRMHTVGCIDNKNTEETTEYRGFFFAAEQAVKPSAGQEEVLRDALRTAYDTVLEFSKHAASVKCISDRWNLFPPEMQDIRMEAADALEWFLKEKVAAPDRSRVAEFINKQRLEKLADAGAGPVRFGLASGKIAGGG